MFALIVSSCSTQQENPVANSGEGKVFFKVSKDNAPAAVTLITMKLTRDGFSPVIGQLNLVTDSTAELLVDGVPEGTWHLKVDALNNNNVVIYTGEADVIVQANFISQVNLTLNPTSTGLGSVKITVNWGTTPVNSYLFKDFSQNPLIVPTGINYDVDIRNPNVIYDGGKFKMYYTSMGFGARGGVSYAESIDGLNWTRPYANPLIVPSDSGSWDSKCITAGAVIKINGVFHLYYQGFKNGNDPWHIGLATSTDGINWVKKPNPILNAGGGWEYQLVPTSIVKKGNLYYLYFTGRNYPEYKIGVATSEDGVNFTKYAGNPILSASLGWEGIMNSSASVIAEGDSLVMVYSSKQGNKCYFGWATSVNGFNWTKNPSPIFDNFVTTLDWGRFSIDYPVLVKTDNQYRIYYGGSKANEPTKIGVTIKNVN
jgi:predicted GH43/DUF377 family glycosyl hydrolase